MSTAKNYAFNRRSAPGNSRGKMIAAIQIEWKNLRRDLRDDAEALREERLIWIQKTLGLRHELHSMTALSDKQLGIVLDEIRKLTRTPRPSATTAVAKIVTMPNGGGAEIVHLSSEEQLYAIGILTKFIEWNSEKIAAYLKPRFRVTTERMLTHKQCNSFMMHLLNIAASKDLKRMLGKDTKVSRKMAGEHIPSLKRKLGIDQGGK